jgi:ribose transport system substrate-binding protein
LRRPTSKFLGSVAYFPEKYGEGLVRLALDVLNYKAVPPGVFVGHQLLNAKNVDRFYSEDALH